MVSVWSASTSSAATEHGTGPLLQSTAGADIRSASADVFRTTSTSQMVEYTSPVGLHTIFSGTILSLSTLGGDVQDTYSWTCDEDHDIAVLSLSINRMLCERYKIPRRCIHLQWARPEMRRCGDYSDWIVVVTYFLIAIPADDDQSVPDNHCYICERPCRDADDDDTRELNCVRCLQCWLCGDCKVIIAGKPCCYFCLEGGEVDLVPNRVRLRVLCPDLFE